MWKLQDLESAVIWSEKERCSSKMKPRLRAEWVTINSGYCGRYGAVMYIIRRSHKEFCSSCVYLSSPFRVVRGSRPIILHHTLPASATPAVAADCAMVTVRSTYRLNDDWRLVVAYLLRTILLLLRWIVMAVGRCASRNVATVGHWHDDDEWILLYHLIIMVR